MPFAEVAALLQPRAVAGKPYPTKQRCSEPVAICLPQSDTVDLLTSHLARHLLWHEFFPQNLKYALARGISEIFFFTEANDIQSCTQANSPPASFISTLVHHDECCLISVNSAEALRPASHPLYALRILNYRLPC